MGTRCHALHNARWKVNIDFYRIDVIDEIEIGEFDEIDEISDIHKIDVVEDVNKIDEIDEINKIDEVDEIN